MNEKEIYQFLLSLKRITSFYNDYILINKEIPRLYRISQKIYDNFRHDPKILSLIKNDYINLKRWSYLPDKNKINYYLNQKSILSLRVSEECNLACRYCYNKKNMLNNAGIRYMPKITAKRALDFFISNFSKKNTTIVFFGGEPLLNFGTIKYLLNYIKTKYKYRNFELKLVTNGTILNREIINTIIENNIKIMISLDLPPCQHNYNRPFKNGNPSFMTIKNNLELLLKHIPKKDIILRTVIPHNSKFKPEDIISSLYEVNLPIENICLTTEFGSRASPAKRFMIDKEKRELIKKHREYLLDSCDKKLYKREIIGNMLYIIIEGRHHLDECPAGKDAITINPIGEIYFCDVIVNKKEFYIGNIEEGIKWTKLKKLNDRLLSQNITDCASCWASCYCGKFCPLTRQNKELLLKKCDKQKKEFLDDLFYFLNLDYARLENLLYKTIHSIDDESYIKSQCKSLSLFLDIYKFLNQNNKYIKPINILPY